MSTTTTDPIADMLSRIRNAIAVNKHEVALPHSKVKEAVANILQQNRYLDDVSVEGETVDKTLKIAINKPETNARITEITRLSKPGRRYYTGADKIPVVKRGRGIVIVSTSKGLMTGDDARKQGIGGELICRIY